jgi:putative DNA primase/helicase
VDYFAEARRVGRFPAILADIFDINAELVGLHVTHLRDGRKLAGYEPRKKFGKTNGHVGCAARLIPDVGDVLGIGEGIETCLAAAQIHGVPTWAALDAPLLAKFEPPAGVRSLIVFADGDEAGRMATACLTGRLRGRVHLEVRTPPPSVKDWADFLVGIGPV